MRNVAKFCLLLIITHCIATSARATTTAQQPLQYFDVAPNRCVTKSEQCQLFTLLSWRFRDLSQVCLKIYDTNQKVICNLPAEQKNYSLQLTIIDDVNIEIYDPRDEKVLGQQTISILYINERKPRRRIAWSIF